MKIDVWSDVVCPWCFIGFTRLEKALEQTGIDAEIYHHAYQLDRHAENDDRRMVEVLAEKYGIAVEDAMGMQARVTEIAAEDGLNYKLNDTPHGNTKMAHRLLAFAAKTGHQHDLLFSLFRRYFEEAKSVFDRESLLEQAVAVGMDAAAVAQVLDSDAYEDVVDFDYESAERIGVQGVPFFVFNERIAVPGAEAVATFVQAIEKAQELAVNSKS